MLITPTGSGMRAKLHYPLFGLVGACALSFLATVTGMPGASASPACPNEALRTGLSGSLPDCRAYEMVSPPFKNGAPVSPNRLSLVMTDDGRNVLGESYAAFSGAQNAPAGFSSVKYLFSRGASSWSTTPLDPPAPALGTLIAPRAYSGSLEKILWQQQGEHAALWIYEKSGSLTEVGPTIQAAATVTGISMDLNHVVFEDSRLPFDQSLAGPRLYEYVGTGNAAPHMVAVRGGAGSTDLVGRCGSWTGGDSSNNGGGSEDQPGSEYNAVSEDGETVFFTVNNGPTYEAPYEHSSCSSGGETGEAPKTKEVFARLHGSETVWVSEPQCEPITNCHNVVTDTYTTASQAYAARVVFEGASADGSKVFFTTTQQLMNSDTDATKDLYEYDFTKPVGERLRQVSIGGNGDPTPGVGANVAGVARISEDGSHVYFVATGVLTTEPNSQGQAAVAGADNLYVSEPDASVSGIAKTVFVAELCSGGRLSGSVIDSRCSSTLDSNERNDRGLWNSPAAIDAERQLQTTPNGRFLVFVSHGRLTADTGTSGAAQLFLYDAHTNTIQRISIGEEGFNSNGNPSGSAEEVGDAQIAMNTYRTVGETTFPAGTFNRTMSDDGSYVFFESPVALTPQALNDVRLPVIDPVPLFAENVYEYHEGHVYLISDGRDVAIRNGNGASQIAHESSVQLLGTNANGSDVFFSTADPLVPQDGDTQVDFYDARIGGGYPPEPARTRCEGDSCRGPASPVPGSEGAGSATFVGPGNPRGQLPHRRRHHHRSHHRHRHGSRAVTSSGGAK